MSIERLQKARVGLYTKHPFFGMLSLRLDLVEDTKVKSTVVNGKTLRFNPAWADTLPMDEVEGAFASQVMTCALGHHLRRGGRDAKTWNEASDYAVHAELLLSGFKLPPGALIDTDGRYKGLTAEAIYSKMKQDQQDDPQQQPQGGGQPQQGGNKGEGEGKDQPSPANAQKPGSGKPEDGAGADATGSFDDPENKDGTGKADEAEVADQEADWQTAVAMAAQASRGAGKLPGGIERIIGTFLNPRVQWQEALQRYFSQRAKDDYSWSRPNRRFAHMGLYLPSLDSRKVGTIAIAMDWSGSVNERCQDQFVAEIEDIRQTLKPERIIVMIFNTQVTRTLEFGPFDPLDGIKGRSGGGTAFDDPVRVLDDMNVTPEVLVYLTDLDSSVFPREPNYPVLWVSTMKTRAPFGEVIKMDSI